MKTPRLDAFVPPEKVRELASPLDDMPAIQPPRSQPPDASTPSLGHDVTRSGQPTEHPPAIERAPASVPKPREVKREGGKEGSREVGNPPSASAPRWPRSIGDLAIKPYRKDSYLFTDEEFNAMDELKLDLRKHFQLATTKNELARVALRQLLNDYEERGEESFLVHILRERVGK